MPIRNHVNHFWFRAASLPTEQINKTAWGNMRSAIASMQECSNLLAVSDAFGFNNTLYIM